MKSYQDALQYIRGTLGEFVADHTVEAIAETLWEITGTWDMSKASTADYWRVVEDYRIGA